MEQQGLILDEAFVQRLDPVVVENWADGVTCGFRLLVDAH